MSCPMSNDNAPNDRERKASWVEGGLKNRAESLLRLLAEEDATKAVNKCEWALNGANTPHSNVALKPRQAVCESALDCIGNTPLVRLRNVEEKYGLDCEMYAKCEFFNAGGSVKDRIALRMIIDAEKAGKIKPGSTLIEPTSGNTGIGLALVGALRGYKVIVTMPEKMSNEKVSVLRALGAQIYRTPTEAAFDSPESHINLALRLNEEIPDSIILDQYGNPGNPLAHYDGTAEEIIQALDGKIDMLVAGAGTGGTISGLSRKFKEKVPDCTIVGVDPWGSILAQPESMNETDVTGYQVEGIGYDFIPYVCDRSNVDTWVKSNDKDSFLASRMVIKEEGLLVGGSTGSALSCALEQAKSLKKGQRCVVIFPDSVRNYMTKFLDDEWMEEHEFTTPSSSDDTDNTFGGAIVREMALPTPVTVSTDVSCKAAVELMGKGGFDQLPIVDAIGNVSGVVTEGNLLLALRKKGKNKITASDPVNVVAYKKFKEVQLDTPLWKVSRYLDKEPFVLVTASQQTYCKNGLENKKLVLSIITRIDLINHMLEN